MVLICLIVLSTLLLVISSNDLNDTVISNTIFDLTYERLSFFSKISALTNCISYGQLYENKSFLDGGCPPHLQFCSDIHHNPFADQVIVKKIILAKSRFDLGTGYIAIDHHNKVINMAFRGSSTRWDWVHDFLVMPTDYIPFSFDKYEEQINLGNIPSCDHCRVHSGFNMFLSSLQESFLEILEDIYSGHPDYNLVISGHSLGGAIAILCGLEVKIRGYNPTVVTYAQPKIFNSKMSEWVNEMFDIYDLDGSNRHLNTVNLKSGYYRVVHINDYVTDLPPLYSHAGLQININKIMLPHEKDDLSYAGLDYSETDLILLQNNNTGFVKKIVTSDLLHLYEHRHYFIQINECDYL